MLDDFALGHEDDLLADVLGHVADPLEVLRDERQPERPRDVPRIFHHVGQELAEQGIVHLVDIAIAFDDFLRQFGITLRKQHYPMSFTVKLDEFTHEYHPGTMQPRVFRSDVTVLDGNIEEQQAQLTRWLGDLAWRPVATDFPALRNDFRVRKRSLISIGESIEVGSSKINMSDS